MGCLHQVDIKCRSLTWYTVRSLCPLLWRWGHIGSFLSVFLHFKKNPFNLVTFVQKSCLFLYSKLRLLNRSYASGKCRGKESQNSLSVQDESFIFSKQVCLQKDKLLSLEGQKEKKTFFTNAKYFFFKFTAITAMVQS